MPHGLPLGYAQGREVGYLADPHVSEFTTHLFYYKSR
jgi:hypothetical protein